MRSELSSLSLSSETTDEYNIPLGPNSSANTTALSYGTPGGRKFSLGTPAMSLDFSPGTPCLTNEFYPSTPVGNNINIVGSGIPPAFSPGSPDPELTNFPLRELCPPPATTKPKDDEKDKKLEEKWKKLWSDFGRGITMYRTGDKINRCLSIFFSL